MDLPSNQNEELSRRKVFVIGLDGATFDLIKPWMEQGKLPNIAKLIKEGNSGYLQSTIPPITPPAWTSFMTGKNPGKHGIFHFIKRKRGITKLVTSKDIDAKCIWDYLSEKNKNSIVLNVPMTYPPRKINGIMISGFDTPSIENCAYPNNIIKELKRMGYVIFPNQEILNHPEKRFSEILKVIDKRKEAAIYLMKNYEYDFFMVEFQMTDSIRHITRDENKIFEVYQKVDDAIAEFLRNINYQQTNVIIMSDHGMIPIKKVIRFNRWLQDLGLYNTTTDSQKEYTSYNTLKSAQHGIRESSSHNSSRMIIRLLKASFNLLSSLGITVERLDYLLSGLRIDFLKKIVPENALQSLPRTTTDWRNTKAYLSDADYQPGISVNLRGREPQGVVEPGKEYEELRDYIIQELYILRDPENDEKIIEKALKKEEVYSGPHLNESSDIQILTKNQEYISAPTPYGNILSKDPNEICTHKMNGIFIAYGPDIKQGQINGAEIIDIAPTILHIMGVPIPKDIDGRVLKEIFEEDSELAKREILYQEISEKERIKEEIKKLTTLRRI